MRPLAGAGQHPFETVIRQALYATHLVGPGIPADIARCRETLAMPAPPDVVAREQKLAMQQDAMAARVTWRRYGEEVRREFNGQIALDHTLGVGLRSQLQSVNDALGTEAAARLCAIGGGTR